jgi:acetyl-CoA acetyltransferase
MTMDSVAFAVNRLCGSSQQAIISSAQAILLGDADFAHRRRRRSHVARRLPVAGDAFRRAHGRHQDDRLPWSPR